MADDERFIPLHGGYEKLRSFQKARIVYDGTVRLVQSTEARSQAPVA